MPIEWKTMETAPHNGLPVLVAASRLIGPDMRDALREHGSDVPTEAFIARFSTWDRCWRVEPGGMKLTTPDYLEPHLFAEIGQPPVNPAYDKVLGQ